MSPKVLRKHMSEGQKKHYKGKKSANIPKQFLTVKQKKYANKRKKKRKR